MKVQIFHCGAIRAAWLATALAALLTLAADAKGQQRLVATAFG